MCPGPFEWLVRLKHTHTRTSLPLSLTRLLVRFRTELVHRDNRRYRRQVHKEEKKRKEKRGEKRRSDAMTTGEEEEESRTERRELMFSSVTPAHVAGT